MPKVPKPGTSAEHQRAAEATALKRVKKLLKLGKSFDEEDDRVLRIRDEHLEALRLQNSEQSSKPTLSAEEAETLVVRLYLCAVLSAPPASSQPSGCLGLSRFPSGYFAFDRATSSTDHFTRATRASGASSLNYGIMTAPGETSALANIFVRPLSSSYCGIPSAFGRQLRP
jgi:hypothetical protein